MIYIADISNLTCSLLESRVCPERITYSSKYKFEIDRRRGLAVEALLNYALVSEGYEQSVPVNVSHMDNQRPYFLDDISINGKKVFFSLSHAGDYVAVALDFSPIGIDIEQMKGNNVAIAAKYYSEDEKKLMERDPLGKEEGFIRVWTLKEAFLKALGCGLSLGINSFSVNKSEGNLNEQDDRNPMYEHISEIDLFAGREILTRPLTDRFCYIQSHDENNYKGYNYLAPKGYAVSVCALSHMQ